MHWEKRVEGFRGEHADFDHCGAKRIMGSWGEWPRIIEMRMRGKYYNQQGKQSRSVKLTVSTPESLALFLLLSPFFPAFSLPFDPPAAGDPGVPTAAGRFFFV